MLNEARILYWDSNVFLNYINENPSYINTIESLLQEIQDNDDEIIVTSVISKVEVAFASYEKAQGVLDPKVEADIDALWEDSSVVELIEFNDEIALMARSLMRETIQRGWGKLTTNDAIHLASAQWMQSVTEFHTYDKSLDKYGSLIGCAICEPYVLQPKLID
jgi:predicted nucleic acid-binding protein